MDIEEEGEVGAEEEADVGEAEPPKSVAPEEEDEDDEDEEEEEEKGDQLEEDINLTDSQVMIQLREAEEEAAALRKEIAALRTEIDDYQCRAALTEEDEEHLQEIQLTLMEKIAQLDELTKRIAKLMEMAAGRQTKSEETTILEEEEEEEGFPDDLLPKVVICSSWDDMMPKVVVCMDMKKPGAAKKKEEDDRDENGLTPEQREALEQERRCMAEERNRLQYQIACMEGEMRVMMRENDMLSKKIAQMKADMENQPPFEFEMSVSAANPPGCGPPKPGNVDVGYGVMGPDANGTYTVGGTVAPGGEYQGQITIPPPTSQYPGQMGGYPQTAYRQGSMQMPQQQANRPSKTGNLPCGGVTGTPGKSVPCPQLQPPQPSPAQPNDWPSTLPPYGKKCRKDFNAATAAAASRAGGSCQGCGGGAGCCGGNGGGPGGGFGEMVGIKPQPVDVNFKVNVQPQTGTCDKRASMDSDERTGKIAQQLQEIEMELRRMQRDLCRAKNDKETLKAQQATLNCAKNFLM